MKNEKFIKTLIIYDLIPEKTIKAVVELTEAEHKKFTKCHGYIINATEYDDDKSELVDIISNALCNNPDFNYLADSDEQREYFAKWVEYILKEEDQDLTGVTSLISCGIYL